MLRRYWWIPPALLSVVLGWHYVGPRIPLLYGIVGFDILPVRYHDAPVRGVVVDGDTQTPLPGANVVARWRLQTYPFGRALQNLVVAEAVTDAAGRYEISWKRHYYYRGPRDGFLKDESPELLVFKSGYLRGLSARQFGDRSDQTTRLQRLSGSLEQYGISLGSLDDLLNDPFTAPNCPWKAYPKMLLALEPEAQKLAKAGLSFRPKTLKERDESLSPTWNCGSVTAFLKELSE